MPTGTIAAPLRRLLWITLSISLTAWGSAVAASEDSTEADLYVSTEGNDQWSGRLPVPNADRSDGPLATIAAARDVLRKRGPTARDRVVRIRGGRYTLRQTLVFSMADSAAPGHRTTYAAYGDERPVLSAGAPIENWRRLTEPPEGLSASAQPHVWVADVDELGVFRTLFDGEQRLPRARSRGFRQTNATPRGSQDYQTVEFPRGAIGPYASLRGVELRIIPSHFWVMNLLPVESLDAEAGVLRTSECGTYPLGKNGMTDRPTAWIENAMEELDEPGEWVLDDEAGRLYLWPLGAAPGREIVAPQLTELIRVEGEIDYDGPNDAMVEGLRFEGLTLMHGDRYPWHGRTGWGVQHDWECFDRPTGMVRFRGARRCGLQDCTLAASGHTAIRFDLACQENDVTGCHIHDIGGVGVLLAGYGPGTKNVNRGNRVTNNYIHHIGLEYWGSVAIFAWQSGENRIAHNHIAHLPYTAILSTGRIARTPPGPAECSRTVRWDELPDDFARRDWQGREPYLHSRDNIIEWNNIHNVMERLGDGNCIYVSGAGRGTVVRYNYCHDCIGPYMNAVLRCDDDQHATRIEKNVCFRTRGFAEGIISKGDNDLVNNFLVDLRTSERHRGYITFPYGDIHGTRVEHNILVSRWPDQSAYYHARPSRHGEPPRLRDALVDWNLYYSTTDSDWVKSHLAEQRKVGNEENSKFADPRFVDIDRGDFRFRDDSPAPGMGIEPIDVARAGLESHYRQQRLGRVITTRIAPKDHEFEGNVQVNISSSEPEATIRYTLDGSEPTGASTPYAGPVKLNAPATVRARSFAPGATDPVGAVVFYAAPPAPIVEGFEKVRPGAAAPGATTSEDADFPQYRARVTDEAAASGERCLRITDGPGQEFVFTPHVYYQRTYKDGPMASRLAIKVDEQTAMDFAWRQYDRGYVTGPIVQIETGGRVLHNGQLLTTIPVGRWVRIEMVAELGPDADGTFDLRIWTPGGQSPRVFSGLSCDARFSRLDWIGLISKAKREATHYVDDLEVTRVSP